jgi:hypothetical protein
MFRPLLAIIRGYHCVLSPQCITYCQCPATRRHVTSFFITSVQPTDVCATHYVLYERSCQDIPRTWYKISWHSKKQGFMRILTHPLPLYYIIMYQWTYQSTHGISCYILMIRWLTLYTGCFWYPSIIRITVILWWQNAVITPDDGWYRLKHVTVSKCF